MSQIHNCSDCDYCYTNKTMKGGTHICVNYDSEYFGEPVDWLGLSEADMECVVESGKTYDELIEDEELLAADNGSYE